MPPAYRFWTSSPRVELAAPATVSAPPRVIAPSVSIRLLTEFVLRSMLLVVFAVIATGDEKFACCQPELVSSVKFTLASREPPLVQRCPECTPVLARAL